jgi:hypothetical protein
MEIFNLSFSLVCNSIQSEDLFRLSYSHFCLIFVIMLGWGGGFSFVLHTFLTFFTSKYILKILKTNYKRKRLRMANEQKYKKGEIKSSLKRLMNST